MWRSGLGSTLVRLQYLKSWSVHDLAEVAAATQQHAALQSVEVTCRICKAGLCNGCLGNVAIPPWYCCTDVSIAEGDTIMTPRLLMMTRWPGRLYRNRNLPPL